MKRGVKGKILKTIADRSEKGDPVYLAELSRLVGLSKSYVSKIVNVLIEEGLVTCVRDGCRKYLFAFKNDCWTNHVWSDEEEVALIELNDLTASELSRILMRSPNAIHHKRKQLDIKKNTRYFPKHIYAIIVKHNLRNLYMS